MKRGPHLGFEGGLQRHCVCVRGLASAVSPGVVGRSLRLQPPCGAPWRARSIVLFILRSPAELGYALLPRLAIPNQFICGELVPVWWSEHPAVVPCALETGDCVSPALRICNRA